MVIKGWQTQGKTEKGSQRDNEQKDFHYTTVKMSLEVILCVSACNGYT